MKKRYLFGFGVLALVGAASVYFFAVKDKKDSKADTQIEITAEDDNASIQAGFDELSSVSKLAREAENTRIQALKDQVATLDDLKSIDGEDARTVLLEIVKEGFIENSGQVNAEFFEELIKQDDQEARDALQICILYTEDQDLAGRCASKMGELLVADGVINEGDDLPPEYFSLEEPEG